MSKPIIQKIILGLLLVVLVSPFFIQAQSSVGGAAAAAGTVGWTATAVGSGIMGILAKAIGFIAVLITYIFGYLAGLIFTFAGLFLSFGLKLNGSLLQSPTVNIGWSITRDLANLGFVLAIIFIAIATILRSQKYGTIKILRRLIAVALLINFSLTFAGILIDASGLMTNFFMAKVVPPGGGTSFSSLNSQSMAFSAVLANAFGIQKALDTNRLDAKKIQSASEFGATTFTLIANIFFVVLFTIFGAVVMLATAALVFVRYVVLMILLILMPLAWLGWVFEESAFYEIFQKWWKTFIEWLIWLPAAMFFIYLTILIVVNQSQDPNSVTQIAKSIQTAPQGNVLDNFLGFTGPPTTGVVGVATGVQGSGGTFETFGQMLAVLGIMSFGLVMAKRISGDGAKIVMGLAGKAQGYLLGKVKGAAQKTLGVTSGYYGYKAGLGALGLGSRGVLQNMLRSSMTGRENKPALGQRLVNGLTRFGFRGTAANLAGYMAKGKESVADIQKKYYANLNDDALTKAPTLGGIEYQAARGLELAKRDKLDKISKSDFDSIIEATRKMGSDKELLTNRPDLADLVKGKPGSTEEIDKATKKISDLSAVSKKAFENINVLLALNNSQLNKIRKSDKITEDTIDSIKKQLVKSFGDVSKEINEKRGSISNEQLTQLIRRKENLQQKVRITYLSPSWSIKEVPKKQKRQPQPQNPQPNQPPRVPPIQPPNPPQNPPAPLNQPPTQPPPQIP